MDNDQKQIDYILATLAIENMTPGESTIHLCERMDTEGLSADDAVSILFAQYDV